MVFEDAGVRLLLGILPITVSFDGQEVLDLVEPGLYKKHRG